jgi:hypothetical protein
MLSLYDSWFEEVNIDNGGMLIILESPSSSSFVNSAFKNINSSEAGGRYMRITNGGLEVSDSVIQDIVSFSDFFVASSCSLTFNDSLFEDIIVTSPGKVISVLVGSGEYFLLNGCIFERCSCEGEEESTYSAPLSVIFVGDGAFKIDNSEFRDCFSTASKIQALYVNAISEFDDFSFENLRFNYTWGTADVIIQLEIGDGSISDDIFNDDAFTSKFVNLCPFLNSTNFVVNNKSLHEFMCVFVNVYVSDEGENIGGCGNVEDPCLTISFGNLRVVSTRYYESMSVVILYNKNKKYIMNIGCEIEDITLSSTKEREEDYIIEVEESAWETENIGGVFSIINTSSAKLYNLKFHLPSSLSPSNYLPPKPFIYHCSSGLLILELITITSLLTNGNRNVLYNGNDFPVIFLSNSLIEMKNGDLIFDNFRVSNLNLLNGNGSVINALVNSGRNINIYKSEFKDCVITMTSEDTPTSYYGYGGAIYIEIKEGGTVLIEDKYSIMEESYTFDGCGVRKEGGTIGGYGGAIAIYMSDGVIDTGFKFSGIETEFRSFIFN